MTDVATRPAPESVTALRNARVAADGRRVRRALATGALAGLVGVVVLLVVSGMHTNAQIDQLRDRGVPVTVTVTGCLGQLGGSGSNAAGYTCSGAFTLGGTRYDEVLPGTVPRASGSTLAAVAVPGDPALVTPAATLAGEHASARVFALPAVLAVALVTGLAGLALRRHRRPVPERTTDG